MYHLVNKEFLQGRSYEADIIKKLNKKKFYSIIKKKGFDPENFLYVKKFTFKLTRQFNASLRRSYRTAHLLMYEAILFIEEDYTTMDTIVNLLDEKNKQIVRNECSKKFHINDDDSILFEILS